MLFVFKDPAFILEDFELSSDYNLYFVIEIDRERLLIKEKLSLSFDEFPTLPETNCNIAVKFNRDILIFKRELYIIYYIL